MDETNQLHDLYINVRLSAAKIRSTQSSLERSVVTYARDSNKEKNCVSSSKLQFRQSSRFTLYHEFLCRFRLSTLYFWLAGKTKTKQVVNRMSKWVEGAAVEKATNPGRRFLFFSRLRRSCARLDKTAMLRRLNFLGKVKMRILSGSLYMKQRQDREI